MGCTLAGMSPVFIIYLKAGRFVLVYICKKGMGGSINTPYHTTLPINWFLNNQDMPTSMEKHDAQTRLMIWRRKMLNKGFTSKEYKQFEKDVYNGYIAEDVAETLTETKEVLSKIEKSNKQSHNYFLYSIVLATIGISISIASLVLSNGWV